VLLRTLGMSHLEFRSAWGTNVLDLDREQLARARQIFSTHGLRVSSIGSPVGKIFIDEDFDIHLDRARHAVGVAHQFGARYIRIFSFFIRNGENPDDHRDEVLRRMSALAGVAEEGDVILLHENEKEIYGDIPRRCVDILEAVGSPNLRAAWDAANFVQVPAGRGDGEVVETIRALRQDGYDGFFSLEPHLSQAHSLGGFSGPDLFAEAWQAFTGLLKTENIPYR
jgi:sugar phosphate isomerase/epimerase